MKKLIQVMSLFASKSNPELRDIKKLILIALLIPFSWFILTNWNFIDLLTGNDSPIETLFFRDLKAAGGDWTQLIYNLSIFGGVAFHGTYNTHLFNQLLAWAGLPQVLAYNLSLFLIQILISFLAVESAWAMASIWTSKRQSEIFRWDVNLLAILILGFHGSIAWRLGWGNQLFVSGILPILSAYYLFLTPHCTIIGLLMAWLAALQGLTSNGYQIIFYSVIFLGGPLLTFAFKAKKEVWIRTSIVFLSALTIALPRMSELMRLLLSKELARTSDTASIVYSYITGNWYDIFALFLFSPEVLPAHPNPYLWQESNHLIGPSLILLFLVPWRKHRTLALVIGVCFAALVSFALNISPFSDWIANIPGVNIFRNPLRAFMPFCLFLSIACTSAMISKLGTESLFTSWKKLAPKSQGYFVGVIFLIFTSTLLFEGFAKEVILILTAVIAFLLLRKQNFSALSLPFLFLLGLSHVWAFGLRLSPGPSYEEVVTKPETTSEYAIENGGSEPLKRWSIKSGSPVFGANAGWSMNLDTLDGYFPAPGRLLLLISTITETPLNSTASYLIFPSHDKNFPVFQQLYNLVWELDLSDPEPKVSKLAETPGQAWFAESIQLNSSLSKIVEQLKAWGTDFKMYHKAVLVTKEDAPTASLSGNCEQSKILGVHKGRVAGEVLSLSYENSGQCPLVISMNYYKFLSATIEQESTRTEVPLFPAYGALTATIIPQGKGTITIFAHPVFTNILRAIFNILGGLLLVTAVILAKRSSRE